MISEHLADRRLTWSPLNAGFAIRDPEAGELELSPPRKKVVLYGSGMYQRQATVKLFDPEWEVWNLNLIPALDGEGRVRADRWFDIHQRVAQTPDDMRWIESCPRPIYVPPDLLDAGPTCLRFPVERVEQFFGGINYWSCTFAYQIALAVMEGFTDIGMYGMELAYGTRRERTVEWACTSYWMGQAEARGVVFHLPTKSRLGTHPYRYGLEYAAEIDEVNEYLAASEDYERQELAQLDARRAMKKRGLRADVSPLPSVGG